jgi:hypothetical protein
MPNIKLRRENSVNKVKNPMMLSLSGDAGQSRKKKNALTVGLSADYAQVSHMSGC